MFLIHVPGAVFCMGKALLNLPCEPPNINEMHIWKFVFVVSSYILGVSPGRELQMLSPCRKPPPIYIVQEHDIDRNVQKNSISIHNNLIGSTACSEIGMLLLFYGERGVI